LENSRVAGEVKTQGIAMIAKAQRKLNGHLDFSEAPSHLMRRCQQFYGDLYAREYGTRDLTKQQFTVLAALEHHEGVSQTALVEVTGIDRSTLAEMIRRMLDKGLISRQRTEEDQRANAVAITTTGRKALRGARAAADRAEKALLEALPVAERPRFVKMLAAIAAAAEERSVETSAKLRRKTSARKRLP
jgi:DNA-binding MarR family transcriptional regulator